MECIHIINIRIVQRIKEVRKCLYAVLCIDIILHKNNIKKAFGNWAEKGFHAV